MQNLFFRCAILVLYAWSTTSFGAGVCDNLEVDILLETSPVKDQCKTGSCWAHPAVAIQENRIRVRTGRDIPLSEEFYYIQRITNRVRAAMLSTTKGNGMQTITDLIAKAYQSSTPERAMDTGVVPDVVAQSKIISTSRDAAPTYKDVMFQRIADVFREFNLGFRASVGDQKMVRKHLAKATEQLKAIEAEFQQRVPEKWRKNSEGIDEFEFEGSWYTPQSFQKQFVFGGKEPKFGSRAESAAATDEILLRALANKDSVALRMAWDDNQWFLENYGKIRSRHALELVGVKKNPDGSIKSFIIKNSYGVDWKNGGFLEIPYNEFHKALRDVNYLDANLRKIKRTETTPALLDVNSHQGLEYTYSPMISPSCLSSSLSSWSLSLSLS